MEVMSLNEIKTCGRYQISKDYLNYAIRLKSLIIRNLLLLYLVHALHITASVFINDDEGGLHQDFEAWLEKLAPEKPHSQYRHNGFEDNADAHMKRQLMGREVVVAVTDGRLDFGPWEQIFYGEYDGMRRKRVLVKIIGE